MNDSADQMRTTGFVYFVRAGRTDMLKIGWAKHDPEARVAALQTGCPHQLHLVGYLPGSPADELGWHDRFKHLRGRGEWFTLAPQLRDAINRLSVDRPDFTRFLSLSVTGKRQRFAVAQGAAHSVHGRFA